MAWRRWLRRGLVAVVFLWAGFVFGFLPYWLAGLAVTRRFDFPDRENGDLTPASYEIPFQPVTFTAGDGVRLSGWWVPAPESHGTVVLVHGMNRRRIEMVSKVPFLREAGWSALLFDLRRHGESGGERGGFGYLEKRDVEAAVDWALDHAAGPVVAWGVSLGAASATLAAAQDARIEGLICDSSFRSLADTVRHHLRLFRGFHWASRLLVPQWPTSELALFWIGRRGGFDTAAVNVTAAAGKLGDRPALFVCNSGDRRMPSEIAFELQEAAGSRAKVLVVPGSSHGGAYREGTVSYQSAVLDVLDLVLAASGTAAAQVTALAPGQAGAGEGRASLEAGT